MSDKSCQWILASRICVFLIWSGIKRVNFTVLLSLAALSTSERSTNWIQSERRRCSSHTDVRRRGTFPCRFGPRTRLVTFTARLRSRNGLQAGYDQKTRRCCTASLAVVRTGHVNKKAVNAPRPNPTNNQTIEAVLRLADGKSITNGGSEKLVPLCSVIRAAQELASGQAIINGIGPIAFPLALWVEGVDWGFREGRPQPISGASHSKRGMNRIHA